MNFLNKRSRKGAFTLIELLVVIAIIGILSSVVLASLSGARESARDVQRQQDIRQINTAIQMYMNDNDGSPPLEGNDAWYYSRNSSEWSNVESALSDHMSQVPADPVNAARMSYIYRAGGSYTKNNCSFNDSEDDYMLVFGVKSELSGYTSFDSGSGYYRYCIVE